MRIGIAILVLGLAAPAGADPIDLLGFGARLPALGNAGVASGDVPSSAFSNPAACARSERLQLALGYSYSAIALRRNGRDQGLPDAHGTSGGACVPIPFPFVRLAFSTAAYIPDQWFARIALQPASQPRFVLWDNRPHRVAFNPTLALRLGRMLAVGGGLTMLADGAGNGIAFRVGIKSGQVIAESALDVELPTRAAPVLAVLFTPRDDVRIGARYSGQLSLDLRLDVLAQVDVPGTPIGGDTLISVRGIDLYTPEQVAGGISIGPLAGWTATTEVVWSNWSRLGQVASDVALLVEIGITPSLIQALFPTPGWHDTFSPRLGVQKSLPVASRATVELRAGYRFEPSPVPDQTGVTSFADGDRHVFGVGSGLRIAGLSAGGAAAPGAWTLDAGLAWHHLVPRATRKVEPAGPGGDFTTDGEVLSASVMTGVEF
ncbi:MAG: outer membrane protein transport protein [Deltaproteobacteria bacterium]|nr:outer membrane protein transport protein [Deltaproteobacteria bacterium]